MLQHLQHDRVIIRVTAGVTYPAVSNTIKEHDINANMMRRLSLLVQELCRATIPLEAVGGQDQASLRAHDVSKQPGHAGWACQPYI